MSVVGPFVTFRPDDLGVVTPDILSQNFESGTTPSGWATQQGSPVYNYQPALIGTYSLGLATGTLDQVSADYTSSSEVFVFAAMNVPSLPSSALVIWIFWNTDFGTTAMQILLDNNGRLYVSDTGSANTASTAGQIPVNSIFYIWCHYKKGTGSDAVCSVAFNTSLSEPLSGDTKFAGFTNGVSTINTGAMLFRANPCSFIVDQVGIATFDMPTGWP